MATLFALLLPVLYALLMAQVSMRRSAAALAARARPLTDPGLRAAFAPLARALGQPDLRLQIYDNPTLNGLAAPDGQIYLTQGFVDAYHAGQVTAPELAGVVAHELGHVTLGHLRRRMIDFTGQNAALVVLSALLSRVQPLIGVWIAQALSTALMARLSQRDEYQADAFAAALMIKASYGIAPQIGLLQRLERLTGTVTAPAHHPPAWMANHPQPPQRIAALQAIAARWGQ